MINQNLLLTGDDGYNLTRSLRFRSSASAYLNRTPASATNRKTWTWSGWVKRGTIGAINDGIFSAGTSFGTNNNDLQTITFNNDCIVLVSEVGGSVQYNLVTSQVFRDPSAWYHFVVAFDTTQATSSNRVKLYVNGVQVTAFSTSTYPSQNYDGWINSANQHRIASRVSPDFDGYMAEMNFIDGQALTPSSFGSTNALTGVWQPAKYTGTYGTNGFYLPFTDNSALTTSSNVGLGKDFSGNGNYWTTNNISITAGVTYDSMTDVPTLTSATTANYAVLNPVYKSASQPTISSGNLEVAPNAVTYQNAFSTIAITTGKWYCELLVTGTPNSANFIGISNQTQLNYLTQTANVIGATTGVGYSFYPANGDKYTNGTQTSYGTSVSSGDIVGIAVDLDNGKIWFSKNGTWQASGDPAAGTNAAFTGIASDLWNIGATVYSGGVTNFAFNFGQRPFAYTPPTGFVALNTFNLPAPTINNGAAYMAATLWDGDGTTSRSISTAVNGVSFQPDFVWVKARNNVREHILEDSVRGLSYNNQLSSNTTGAESSNPSAGGVTGASSTSITLGGTGTMDNVNKSTWTYVGWQWKAGGTAVTNTAGTISSQVSANTTSGFSVVTYTGNATNGATVGHGLGVAPRMIIVKNRSTSTLWSVYHASVGAASVAHLNDTAGFSASGDWNSTAPTSTVFTVGTSNRVNNADNYVAYCWSEVAGYSAFGSYTGNSSTDGTFVYLGFRPKFVLFKNITQASQWILLDSARNTYNVANAYLEPNTSDSENTANTVFDMLSNGFKLRNSGGTDFNENANNYIYMAFAENPFKNSLAR